MSETAQTLINAAFRVIGVIASGETATTQELADGLEALKIMLRHWSDKNIRLYFISQNTITLNGAASYTIGSGGVCDTTRPEDIKGGYVRDSSGIDSLIEIIDEAKYRSVSLKSLSGTAQYLWYNPDFPLGLLYFWPLGSGTAYLDSLKPLSEPSLLSSSIQFPPAYDEAIKWNLALRFCPEYGKEPSPLVIAFALSALNDIESKNFNAQINAINLNEELKGSGEFLIDQI